jgi:hypothetical protein
MTMPIRRDVQFPLPSERACDWHSLGSYVTHFFNALSLLFPAGERYFIDSVRYYRDRIDDPELKKQVLGFIGQEAMHTREHIEYNEALNAAGLPASKLEKYVVKLLDYGRRTAPHSLQLAQTVALEHYTAMLAGMLLDDDSRIASDVPIYAQLWTWHALEETEHKAVSFDVWNAAIRPGLKRYLIRAAAMLQVTLMFWTIVFCFHIRLLIADRHRGGRLRGMWNLMGFLYGRRGVFPNIALDWLRFFKPSFHPWDHDNRRHLARIDSVVAAVEAAGGREGPSAVRARMLARSQTSA